jgi:hypothetical protein
MCFSQNSAWSIPIWRFPKIRYPKMDGLYWKILSEWMIWRYAHFGKPQYGKTICTHLHMKYTDSVWNIVKETWARWSTLEAEISHFQQKHRPEQAPAATNNQKQPAQNCLHKGMSTKQWWFQKSESPTKPVSGECFFLTDRAQGFPLQPPLFPMISRENQLNY